MEANDFDVLYDENASIDYNVDVLNSYIAFCIDHIVPKKLVKCFPNNKPWVTKELKPLLNKKKYLLSHHDRDQLKIVQKEINAQISVCKQNYKTKIENLFKTDSKSAWAGLRELTGMSKSKNTPDVENPEIFCNELNKFFARFDTHDFSGVRRVITNFLGSREAEPITVTEEAVSKSLRSVKIGKAAGPDAISSSVIKLCWEPLTPILRKIFQKSLDETHIPTIWKTSELIPAPKKNPPTCKNDYRPLALTAVMMKCMEKVVKHLLTPQVKSHTDKYQFAYSANRCVEDATLSLTQYVLSHVDKPNTIRQKHYVKILYIDFSSAFNTIQPHLMMQKLVNMNVNAKLILWVNEFLTNRPQYVKLMNTMSDTIVTNTGAPQGCVLSPILFTLYTSDCKCTNKTCQLFKYADDTALVAQCTNNDDGYREQVQCFTNWCEHNYLELNVKKTKEMIVDFRTSEHEHLPLYIGGEIVESVLEYKYLGTIIDDKFTFNQNVIATYKKANSRLYFVRKLSKLNVDSQILEMFYSSIVQSIITFSIICWYGNCSMETKDKLTRIIRNCCKLGINTSTLEELYVKYVKLRCKVIRKDNEHPLHNMYQLLPSGKRLRSTKCRTTRYARSFIPASIKILNK